MLWPLNAALITAPVRVPPIFQGKIWQLRDWHAHGHKGGLCDTLRSVPDIFPIADWTFRTVRQYAMRVHLNPLRNNF
jgi:hypothetical protein